MRALLCFLLFSYLTMNAQAQIGTDSPTTRDIVLKTIPTRWIDAMPLGNGMLGAMVWQTEGKLRISVDGSDMWENNVQTKDYDYRASYEWVYEKLVKGYVKDIHDYDDKFLNKTTYDKKAAGAITLNIYSAKAKVLKSFVSLKDATCNIYWDNKMSFKSFVHATDPCGFFIIENPAQEVKPAIDFPFATNSRKVATKIKKGKMIVDEDGEQVYEVIQDVGLSYTIALKWEKQENGSIVGAWSVTPVNMKRAGEKSAYINVQEAMLEGIQNAYKRHIDWWNRFWEKSSISLPDKAIENQYYRDFYKIGSSFRKYYNPPSLQSVWTADSWQTYPETGQYFNTWNMFLQNLPLYTSNHVEESESLNYWLYSKVDTFKTFTKTYYERVGLSVPAICGPDGKTRLNKSEEALSVSAVALMTYHLYNYWSYTQDKQYLKNLLFPWFQEITLYLDLMTKRQKTGSRVISISTELSNLNRKDVNWYRVFTNFDLSAMKYTFSKAIEIAEIMEEEDRLNEWKDIYDELPKFEIAHDGGLKISVENTLDVSHRNLGHMFAVFPFGSLDCMGNENDYRIAVRSVNRIDSIGYANWTGYSYAWYSCVLSQLGLGDKAMQMLKKVQAKYLNNNSLHINNTGYSKNIGKFTFEGNCLFAHAVQQMLMQCDDGIIKIFPAVPSTWKDVSFEDFKAEGNILVSATLKKGKVSEIRLLPLKTGAYTIQIPKTMYDMLKESQVKNKIVQITQKSARITFQLIEDEEVILTY